MKDRYKAVLSSPTPLIDDVVRARFWRHVDKNGPIVRPELGPCWVWVTYKGRTSARYGGLLIDGHWYNAHRLALMIAKGGITPGTIVTHDCDNMPCVRPSHLREGTYSTNAQEARQRGITHIDYSVKRAEMVYEPVLLRLYGLIEVDGKMVKVREPIIDPRVAQASAS